ncbi:unnamed protein product [Cochlearia groenlandica]
MGLENDIDLLNPPAELEKKRHKLKRLVQSPNSYFMDVKCHECFKVTTVFSHSQTVLLCGNCKTVLCQPTGEERQGLDQHYRAVKGTLPSKDALLGEKVTEEQEDIRASLSMFLKEVA